MEDKQTRFSLHISEETLNTAKALYAPDGCKSVSEYIGKAVDFYNAYLCNRRAPELISSETVDGKHASSSGTKRTASRYTNRSSARRRARQ